jgi:enoyl-CoA hydratase
MKARTKKAIDEGMETSFENGLDIEADFGEVFQTEDVKIGVSSFIKKESSVLAILTINILKYRLMKGWGI